MKVYLMRTVCPFIFEYIFIDYCKFKNVAMQCNNNVKNKSKYVM